MVCTRLTFGKPSRCGLAVIALQACTSSVVTCPKQPLRMTAFVYGYDIDCAYEADSGTPIPMSWHGRKLNEQDLPFCLINQNAYIQTLR